jgi:uncharacterized protein with NAD-binding domain and iron-sulfur cluster
VAEKKRIAVLGSGMASLAAVYGITNEPDWQDEYEITVYQLGWRLGQRIQEHGFHVWFGFYENCFAMARTIYRELGRDRAGPLATFEEAFVPHDQFAMEQEFQGEHHSWSWELATNGAQPGNGLPSPSPWNLLQVGLFFLREAWQALRGKPISRAMPRGGPIARAFNALGEWLRARAHRNRFFHFLREVMFRTLSVLGWLGTRFVDLTLVRGTLVGLLRFVLGRLRRSFGDTVESDLRSYRIWMVGEFVGIALIGILRDRLLVKGFNAADGVNFRAWLRSHGMSETTLESSLVQAAYDSSFALFHSKDDFEMSAGAVLRGGLRMFLMFKGSVVWRFAAGTGDTVFAPLYLVLKQRGVKFEFFHEVTEIVASEAPAAPTIEVIEFNQQMKLAVGEYDPLVVIGGLPCWPAAPLYDQLVDGDALRRSDEDLESYWNRWKGGETRTLRRGRDFDAVICGISVAGLAALTPTLTPRNPAWGEMCEKIQTTRTQAFQLWTTLSPAELGFPDGGPGPILSTFGEPMDTWGDYSVALPAENWPSGTDARGLAEFCGALKAGDLAIPPKDCWGYPTEMRAFVVEAAHRWIHEKLPAIWPNAFETGPDGKPCFRWDVLVDPHGRKGQERFGAQWFRANVDPSERYVLSLPKTHQYRMHAHGTGFENLYICGDWTRNGIEAGCMEAACISGLQAARALSGRPEIIPGEKDSVLGI